MNHLSSNGSSLLRRTLACVSATAAAAIMLFSAVAAAQDGPGPGPLGPGPGCNLVPAKASVGTKVDISEFPPPDSVAVDARLAGPVQLLRSGTFDIPIK